MNYTLILKSQHSCNRDLDIIAPLSLKKQCINSIYGASFSGFCPPLIPAYLLTSAGVHQSSCKFSFRSLVQVPLVNFHWPVQILSAWPGIWGHEGRGQTAVQCCRRPDFSFSVLFYNFPFKVYFLLFFFLSYTFFSTPLLSSPLPFYPLLWLPRSQFTQEMLSFSPS